MSMVKHTQFCSASALKLRKVGGRLGQNPRPRAAPPASGMEERMNVAEHSLLQGGLLKISV